MNEPIISPWLIYWAGRIDFIQAICCIVGLFVTIYAMFVALAAMTDINEDKEAAKAAKIIVCTALVLDMLGVFLPTEKEIYAMYAAKHITPASLKATGEFADKAVDKLIEKIVKASKAMKEEKQ
ncbi:hypothetical protein [Phascolarctobacterium succinatutens]|uniref:hypothetical protein n=1 Tax=Phascolarctobacterium succinatutens TaxID=626940 RepID=UPI0026EF2105|nr:hypothetical protein [Phascolarctobacterium succinatutens]